MLVGKQLLLLLGKLVECLFCRIDSLARLVQVNFSLDGLRVVLGSYEVVVSYLLLNLSDTTGLTFIER